MKLIHTADIHLDTSFVAPEMPPDYGNRRRQSLRDTFLNIIKEAREWPADAVLIAGDLFEQERFTRDTIAFLKQAFESIPSIPVFITPGNHDPYTPTSPYHIETWPDNVKIFSRPSWESVALPDSPLTVHGFGFDGAEPSHNPYGSLQIPRDGRIHVAAGHGSEMGSLPAHKGRYAPFSASAAAATGLRYLALGHYHEMKCLDKTALGTVMAYSGAPEGRHFGETGPHYFLKVTIDEEQVTITPTLSSSVVYENYELNVDGCSTSQEIIELFRTAAHNKMKQYPSDNLARIARLTVRGHIPFPMETEFRALQDALSPEFLFFQFIDETEPMENYEALAHDETSLGAFVRAINKEIEAIADPQRRRKMLRVREIGVQAFQGSLSFTLEREA